VKFAVPFAGGKIWQVKVIVFASFGLMLSNFHVYVALFKPDALLSIVAGDVEQFRYSGIVSVIVTLCAVPFG